MKHTLHKNLRDFAVKNKTLKLRCIFHPFSSSKGDQGDYKGLGNLYNANNRASLLDSAVCVVIITLRIAIRGYVTDKPNGFARSLFVFLMRCIAIQGYVMLKPNGFAN